MVNKTITLENRDRFSKPHVVDIAKLRRAALAACNKLKARVQKDGIGFPSTCSKDYKYSQGENNNWV